MVSLLTTVFIAILSLQYNNVMTLLIATPELLSHYLFASDLLPFMFNNKTAENIVYSPASIYISLALTYLGAGGRTADELFRVLKLEEPDNTNFASKYGDFFKTTFIKSKTENNAPELPMINRLYVRNNIKLVNEFRKIVRKNFNCEAENVDFNQVSMVVDKVNKWVEQQTENKITNIIQPNAVNNNTSAILVNAISFKATWLHPFLPQYTSQAYFHISANKKVKVDLMFADDQFGYFKSGELKGTVLEMPYENSNISMLIILPDEVLSLEKLEKKLMGIDLNVITSELVVQRVAVIVPKFRIEFDINLKETLEMMGCSSMFGEKANLTGIFKDALPQKISNIKHKALLDCNEAGSNAVVKGETNPKSVILDPSQKFFIGNRPFFFVIRNKSTIFFAGHVARF